MYRQIITLFPDKDYKVWCNGEFVLFYKNTSEVKKEFKAGKDDLVGISLRGG